MGVRSPRPAHAPPAAAEERCLVEYLIVVARGLIGTVFAISFLGKAAGRGALGKFVESVAALRVVPLRLVRAGAMGVVGLEGAAAVLVFLPWNGPAVAGMVIAAVLLSVFMAVIGLVLRQGTSAPCRCFGGASATVLGPRHLVRNGVLVAVAVAVAVAGTSSGPEPGTAPGTLAGSVVAVLGGVFLGGLVAFLDDILHVLQPFSACPLPTAPAPGPGGPVAPGVPRAGLEGSGRDGASRADSSGRRRPLRSETIH
ncbi:MauE/DoxX family redox-associated membrane protein [Streptomyces sp. URMC 127]|uniref:MauE/DoxX family redox-associated membrane protein n=1 Tax=Streptomyces sp. URMC 127 TaxID=3423402 RepID=UPI003F19FD45